MQEELSTEIEALQDAIKAELTSRNIDELSGTDYRITWKPVTSSRFDSKAFKATHAELYQQFTRTSTTRRFCLI